MPIVMGIGGDYHYYAIDLDTGNIVEGWEPEFENPTVAAESLDGFFEKLFSGDIKLVI